MSESTSDARSASEPRVIVSDEGRVRVLTLSHPASLNGLGPVMRELLMQQFDRAAADSDVAAIVITGDGGNFSAGSDIGAILDQSLEARTERLAEFQLFLAGWRQLEKPVLIAVEGAAAGGGVSMVLAADWAIGSTDSRFTGGWVALGLAPDAGALWWLVRVLGRKRAFEWVHSRSSMTATDAASSGMLTATCPPGEALRAALERAQQLVSLPAAARAETKRLMAAALQAPSLDDYLPLELSSLASLFASEEHREAVRAFLARRHGG
ncbi:MAG: enoyl-CoA hydratase/isomerase family protein [Cryobacterium sp.]|nr:enoyl-CoA hydratase/isomerase family protein [Cryobacterium sp.]